MGLSSYTCAISKQSIPAVHVEETQCTLLHSNGNAVQGFYDGYGKLVGKDGISRRIHASVIENEYGIGKNIRVVGVRENLMTHLMWDSPPSKRKPMGEFHSMEIQDLEQVRELLNYQTELFGPQWKKQEKAFIKIEFDFRIEQHVEGQWREIDKGRHTIGFLSETSRRITSLAGGNKENTEPIEMVTDRLIKEGCHEIRDEKLIEMGGPLYSDDAIEAKVKLVKSKYLGKSMDYENIGFSSQCRKQGHFYSFPEEWNLPTRGIPEDSIMKEPQENKRYRSIRALLKGWKKDAPLVAECEIPDFGDAKSLVKVESEQTKAAFKDGDFQGRFSF